MGEAAAVHGETHPVLNDALPEAPWLDAALWRLPGTKPLDEELWLCVDDAFAAQMALREHLIQTRRDDVHAVLPEAEEAAAEALEAVLESLRSDRRYQVSLDTVTRPDGTLVPLNRDAPLLTAGRLIQEDICLLQKQSDGQHALTGAILCFPASWTLSEKIGRSLVGLHDPIDVYTRDLARRVQRMFDNLRDGLLLTRSNALLYRTPLLFAPRREAEHDGDTDPTGRFLRSERQVLRLLPKTGAVMFTIHTFVVRVEDLTQQQSSALDQVRDGYAGS